MWIWSHLIQIKLIINSISTVNYRLRVYNGFKFLLRAYYFIKVPL